MIISKYTPKGRDYSLIPFYYAKVIKEITGIMPFSANSKSETNYPYITFDVPTLHDTEAQGSSRNSEIFKTTIMLNVYADSQRDAINISNDIQINIMNYPYIDHLHANGISVIAPQDGGTADLSEFGLNQVYQATIRQPLRIINLVPYTGPIIKTIDDIDKGGNNIGSNYNA